MSYDIVYDKKFIKLSDGRIVPLVLIGSNNCYQMNYRTGRENRERSWWPLFVGKNHKQIADTPEAIMAGAKAALPSAYNEWWMQGGKWVTDEKLIHFFQSGIKNAKTMEEYAGSYRHEHYDTPMLRISVYPHINPNADKFWSVSSTAELEKAVDEVNDYMDELSSQGASPSVNAGFFCNEKLISQVKNPRVKKKPIRYTQDSWFVLTRQDGSCLVRLTKYGYSYSQNAMVAKAFATRKQAEAWLKRNAQKTSVKYGIWTIKEQKAFPFIPDQKLDELREYSSDRNTLQEINSLCRLVINGRKAQEESGQSCALLDEYVPTDEWIKGNLSTKEYLASCRV